MLLRDSSSHSVFWASYNLESLKAIVLSSQPALDLLSFLNRNLYLSVLQGFPLKITCDWNSTEVKANITPTQKGTILQNLDRNVNGQKCPIFLLENKTHSKFCFCSLSFHELSFKRTGKLVIMRKVKKASVYCLVFVLNIQVSEMSYNHMIF